MSAPRNPALLQVQVRWSNGDNKEFPTTVPGDTAILRESQQFRKDIEREVERWMDVLMELPCADRELFRRAVRHHATFEDVHSFRSLHLVQSLYLQPNLYDEVLHERHLASICSYPTCNKRPRRPYSEESRWKITQHTSRNTSIRGPNKRDVVQVAGNPEDGFCSPTCTTRSRWYRSQLSIEPVWARPEIDIGDLKAYQKTTRQGQQTLSSAGEVDLLEDMEDRGEIVIKIGQIKKLGSSEQEEEVDAKSKNQQKSSAAKEKAASDEPIPLSTNPLPISELVAEAPTQPSTFMQKLESTLASLRIYEKESIPQPSQPQIQTADEPQRNLNAVSTSSANPDTRPLKPDLVEHQSGVKGDESSRPASALEANRPAVPPVGAEHNHPDAQESDWEDESEDEETQKVFELALAAREQLKDGSF
ncbi:hypothetical protein NliqN6_5684 [Naganishia liquefaciens]|uniref:RNA polymerase II subunit B1 CTD phosphatase RPAP2 homolog n=1 Tax=Naganishia liquefaciens TaxID=104408 RepID=A0A8H3TY79_9TREE|nr:hypothetical protein NliqN6_5684 [Naganishia liquefaciens]